MITTNPTRRSGLSLAGRHEGEESRLEPRSSEVDGTRRNQLTGRIGLAALLSVTAVLYLWRLGASGDANSFYAAAVLSGTKSWSAFFFGSFDAANFITVDKPPAALWVMELSGRIFGFSSWSMLAPQALEGVAAVALLYATVKRWFGPGAGLLAGLLFAVTPVATLMFRFNNPDALLTLLLVASAYCVVRAVEKAGTRWLVFAGMLLGFAFLTKMLQAFLVLPAFTLMYLVCAPTRFRHRILQVLTAGLAIVVAAGWWVAAVALIPAGSRPYVGGSTNNSILQLILGYNGLGRLTGATGGPGRGSGGPGSGGGGGIGANFSGAPGIGRLFNPEMGTQISWLLPAALISLAALIWLSRRESRTGRLRASAMLWGGWLLVTGAVFSFSQGVIHTYYAVALAPAIAALVAISASELWQRRGAWPARATLAALTGVTAAWSFSLLDRTPTWNPEIRFAVVAAGAMVVVCLLLPARAFRAGATAALAGMLAVVLAGPVAFAADAASVPHMGSTPAAGPGQTGQFGPGGPNLQTSTSALQLGGQLPGRASSKSKLSVPSVSRSGGEKGSQRTKTVDGSRAPISGSTSKPLAGTKASKPPVGRKGTAPPTGSSQPPNGPTGSQPPPRGAGPAPPPGSMGSRPSLRSTGSEAPGALKKGSRQSKTGTAPKGSGSGKRSQAKGRLSADAIGSSGFGAPGGDAATTSRALVKRLQRATSTWAAAALGSQTAGALELGSGRPVMSVGGFNGSDPTPTLAQFQRYVRDGEVRYFVGDSGGFGGPGQESGDGTAISSWVSTHFRSLIVGGVTVYDLRHRKG